MFTAPGAYGCSRKLRTEGEDCTKIKPAEGLPENQNKDISMHSACTYSHWKIHFHRILQQYVQTPKHTRALTDMILNAMQFNAIHLSHLVLTDESRVSSCSYLVRSSG